MGGEGRAVSKPMFSPFRSVERMEAGLPSGWRAEGWGGVWKKPSAVSTSSAEGKPGDRSPCCPVNTRGGQSTNAGGESKPAQAEPCALTSHQAPQVREHAPPGQTPPPAALGQERGWRAGSRRPGPASSRPGLGEGPGRGLGGVCGGGRGGGRVRTYSPDRAREGNVNRKKPLPTSAGRNVWGGGGGTGHGTVRVQRLNAQPRGRQPRTQDSPLGISPPLQGGKPAQPPAGPTSLQPESWQGPPGGHGPQAWPGEPTSASQTGPGLQSWAGPGWASARLTPTLSLCQDPVPVPGLAGANNTSFLCSGSSWEGRAPGLRPT